MDTLLIPPISWTHWIDFHKFSGQTLNSTYFVDKLWIPLIVNSSNFMDTHWIPVISWTHWIPAISWTSWIPVISWTDCYASSAVNVQFFAGIQNVSTPTTTRTRTTTKLLLGPLSRARGQKSPIQAKRWRVEIGYVTPLDHCALDD